MDQQTEAELEVIGLRALASHIRGVQHNIFQITEALGHRATVHDESKYSEAERALVVNKPALDKLDYNTPPYHEALRKLSTAVEAHYSVNGEHTQHYKNGIMGMSLLDIIEMFCDWREADQRNDFGRSLADCFERFEIPQAIQTVMINTAIELKWMDLEDEFVAPYLWRTLAD